MRLRGEHRPDREGRAWSQTSVIIIEDLHWLDEASQDFLETWIAAVEGTRVLMVLTFRPEWSLPSRPASYLQLALSELGLAEVSQVIRDLIGDGPELDRVVAHVAERFRWQSVFRGKSWSSRWRRAASSWESEAAIGWRRPAGKIRPCRRASRR